MSSTVLVILIAAAAVLVFVVGLSLTLIFKGHHIRSEVGENEEMRKRGIKCTAQQMYEDDARLRGKDAAPFDCGDRSCPTCGEDASCK